MDFLSALPPGTAALPIVLFIFGGLITAVWKGLLIPRPFYEERIGDYQKQNVDLREANEVLIDAIRESKENDKTIIQLLEGIQQQYGEGGSS